MILNLKSNGDFKGKKSVNCCNVIFGEKIVEFRCRSFAIEGQLVSEMIVLFIKLSMSGWISITVDEGVAEIIQAEGEPELRELLEINDSFAYPVQNITALNDFLGEAITGLYEYRLLGPDHGCIGVWLELGKSGISVLEVDGRLIIKREVQCLGEGFLLKKIM